MAKAQLLVYSGMPNPSIALSADDKAVLLRRVSMLTEPASGLPTHELGYGGVAVECDHGDAIAALIAFDGVVAVFARANEAPRYVRDRENNVERFVRDRIEPPEAPRRRAFG
jgi:hypothetical protein